MLRNISVEHLARAIGQTYKTMNEVSSLHLAEKIVAGTDERLEEAVAAWLEGREIPDVTHGEYSIKKILVYRNSEDRLMAIRLLSLYMTSPEEGRRQIRMPIRGRR